MLGRCGALLVGLSGAWLLAAGCTASGSNGMVNGPMFDLDSGVGAGPGNDGGSDATGSTGASDANDPFDATKTSPPDDAMAQPGADGGDANGGNDDAGCTSTTALLGGNTALGLFGAVAIGTGELTSSTLTGSLTSNPALVSFNGGFQALVTMDADAGGGSALVALGFSGGSWSTPTPLGGNAGAIGAPAMAAVGSTLQAVYLNAEHFYFHASYASGWNAGTDPVETPDGGTQAFGPVPATAAATATQLVIAYEGNDLLPYAQTWTTGVGWDDGTPLGSATLLANTAMPIVTLDTGDLLVVYAEAGGACSNNAQCLYAVTGTASTPRTWSSPALVNTAAYTPKAPTLAPMTGGRALLAWQGGNGEGYGSIYTSGATPAWSTPAQLTSAQVAVAPSLAQGVCGDDAVAAYVSGGQVYTTHFAAGAWTTPAALPSFSGSTSVSIATSP